MAADRVGAFMTSLRSKIPFKAVFFVKDFRGNSKYKASKRVQEGKPGRKIEVTFSGGEKVVGATQGYDQKSKGFFVFPQMPRATAFAYLS
jgi:hypothetical protein